MTVAQDARAQLPERAVAPEAGVDELCKARRMEGGGRKAGERQDVSAELAIESGSPLTAPFLARRTSQT
jgi:hypothetical protein